MDKSSRLLGCLLVFFAWLTPAHADWSTQVTQTLKGGAAIVADPAGKILWQHNEQRRMTPASILKIATVDAALTLLGEAYQFKTEFYLTANNRLGIRGFGDPSLVSEALETIAQQLQRLSLPPLTGFVLDTSYFADTVPIHGQSQSDNPYDAVNGALVANFNTIYAHKHRDQSVTSAEPQTPITAMAKRLAKPFPPGKHRINVGAESRLSHQYLIELMQALLHQHGVDIPLTFVVKPIPTDAKLLFTHHSAPLPQIAQGLLKYSNNFTANQLLLVLGAEQYGPPASVAKGRKAIQSFLKQLGLADIRVEEGSGLSRKNRATALEMLRIVQHFAPYKALLTKKDAFLGKTGTLSGVSTYAGFMQAPNGLHYPFVIMLDQAVPFNYRFKIAEKLSQHLLQ